MEVLTYEISWNDKTIKKGQYTKKGGTESQGKLEG